jgi:hypothetical protein
LPDCCDGKRNTRGNNCLQEQKVLLERRDGERNACDDAGADAAAASEERLRWLSTYQSLAAARMAAQQGALAPLMVAAKQSAAELRATEELQARGPCACLA